MSRSLGEGEDEFKRSAGALTSQKVREALDAVRPGLLADGGNVELVGVDEDGTVRVALQGACAICPSAAATLRLVIEPRVTRSVPGATSVIVAP
jgi:Fe-S cluster biogenesis protein NfuA